MCGSDGKHDYFNSKAESDERALREEELVGEVSGVAVGWWGWGVDHECEFVAPIQEGSEIMNDENFGCYSYCT